MPVIGFLSTRSPGESAGLVAAFRDGLRESGFVEAQNLVIAFRWAEGRYEQLRDLAAELVATACGGANGGGRAALGACRQGGDLHDSHRLLGGLRSGPT